MREHALSSTAEPAVMARRLLLTTPNLELGRHTFVPEDFGVPGQQGLQKHWHVTLGFIVAQVVLQFSGKQEKKSMVDNDSAKKKEKQKKKTLSTGFLTNTVTSSL